MSVCLQSSIRDDAEVRDDCKSLSSSSVSDAFLETRELRYFDNGAAKLWIVVKHVTCGRTEITEMATTMVAAAIDCLIMLYREENLFAK